MCMCARVYTGVYLSGCVRKWCVCVRVSTCVQVCFRYVRKCLWLGLQPEFQYKDPLYWDTGAIPA